MKKSEKLFQFLRSLILRQFYGTVTLLNWSMLPKTQKHSVVVFSVHVARSRVHF